MRLSELVMVVCLCAMTAPCQADIYKWVDADGNVHYGDRPGGAPAAERLDIKVTAPDDPRGVARRAQRDRLLEIFEEEREERQQLAADAAAARQERRQKCAEAKERRFKYETAGYIYSKDEAGNRRILSDAEHAQVRRKTAELVKEWCD